MDNLSVADIIQQYLNNLVSYKGQIVYVMRVFADKQVKLLALNTRLYKTVEFKSEDFSVIKCRLGMVNVLDAVVYATRNPVRKMGIGLNKGNINVVTLPIKYPQGQEAAVYEVQALVSEGVLQTLTNTFPAFGNVFHQVLREAPSTQAFDRQFAVGSDCVIYYKTLAVGVVAPDATSVTDIKFASGYQHLSILLENNHEKTIGHSCP